MAAQDASKCALSRQALKTPGEVLKVSKISKYCILTPVVKLSTMITKVIN